MHHLLTNVKLYSVCIYLILPIPPHKTQLMSPCHHLSDNVPCVVTPVGGDSVVLGHVQCRCILWQWLAQR